MAGSMNDALGVPSLLSVRLAPSAIRRGLLAGTAWGLVTGGGLAVLNALSCGILCVEDAAVAIGVSILVGCATMGPLAALSPSIDRTS